MGIDGIIVCLFVFTLGFIMIFKPNLLISFYDFFYRRFYGLKRERPLPKIGLISIRIFGILLLIAIISILLEDIGFTERNILVEVLEYLGSKTNPEIALIIFVLLGSIVGMFGVSIGILGIINPNKFHSFLREFGYTFQQNHLYQKVFYRVVCVGMFIGGSLLLYGMLSILKQQVKF